MKKKQHNTTVLLIAVIAIWSVLIYKVVTSLSSNEAVSTIEPMPTAFNKNKPIEKRTEFELYIPERDPFLGIVINPPKKSTTAKPNPRLQKKSTINLDSLWNEISYKGMLSNKGKELFLFTYNGNEIILKHNASYRDVKLIEATSETVTLQHKSQKKQFTKQK